MRKHTELPHHAFIVVDDLSSPIELNDMTPSNALRKVLVVTHDDHLIHPGIIGCHLGSSANSVIGFQLHHRPHLHAKSHQGLFERMELRSELSSDPLASLIASPQLVAKRLD